MYDYGLRMCLLQKEVNPADAINKYLQYKNVTTFKPKHHNHVNQFIQANWNNFATFIHNSIINGSLKGKAVRLNTYFAEQKEYTQNVAEEFKNSNVSEDENLLLMRIRKEYGTGFIQSFLMKRGVKPESKHTGYFSKTLQWLPLVRQAIAYGILIEEKEVV